MTPPAFTLWYRPLYERGQRRVWVVIGEGATWRECLDRMNGSGDYCIKARGERP
jgi:hypothetical protein